MWAGILFVPPTGSVTGKNDVSTELQWEGAYALTNLAAKQFLLAVAILVETYTHTYDSVRGVDVRVIV